jgi:hypothetical protein
MHVDVPSDLYRLHVHFFSEVFRSQMLLLLPYHRFVHDDLLGLSGSIGYAVPQSLRLREDGGGVEMMLGPVAETQALLAGLLDVLGEVEVVLRLVAETQALLAGLLPRGATGVLGRRDVQVVLRLVPELGALVTGLLQALHHAVF